MRLPRTPPDRLKPTCHTCKHVLPYHHPKCPDVTAQLFTLNCKTHSCPREADSVDGYCPTCRQIRFQKRTGTLTKENEWSRDVIRLAQTLGWRAAHFRPAMTKHGWKTAVAGDGAGFPDLCLVRDRIVFAELKNEIRELDEQQLEWIAALQVAGVEAYVWRPQDLDEIMRVLVERRRKVA